MVKQLPPRRRCRQPRENLNEQETAPRLEGFRLHLDDDEEDKAWLAAWDKNHLTAQVN